ncbi:MAG: DUF5683 domain-containing protein [Hymenobacteraceae bacterium]|nr:DUF5683 domain-containing protein [Hymenobacteraceae bacterium]MDX5397570.1 DUF5683 domain-containing protein [Hymenobacteraceae bacterium]MDX5444184.1 DUF5683 domain-containing protein [Hymenobacteraceae bacterium]MDX5513650.1 DUF5683 domain-containing protein [Hymenobacteraceae bacterium]
MLKRALSFLFLVMLLAVASGNAAFAQIEEARPFGDTTETKKKRLKELESAPVAKNPKPGMSRPAKAALFSAILPGLGQVYNQKYWKLPILYAGAGAVGYFIVDNHNQYNQFKEAYEIRIDGDPNTVDEFDGRYSDNIVRARRNYFRRERDRFIIGAVLLYGLNIVDALVDAHLKDFDISDDLSMYVKPDLIPMHHRQLVPALTLTLDIK